MPGTHSDLTALLAGADAKDLANLAKAQQVLARWTFDTPSGMAEESPTPDQIADSQATLVHGAWLPRYLDGALGDELKVLGQGWADEEQKKLVARMLNEPAKLKTGVFAQSGDALLFDDVSTPLVVEGKGLIAARALLLTLGFLRAQLGDDLATWRWGQLHTLMLDFAAPVDPLNIPTSMDAKYPKGFPRHGDDGTVDVASHGLSFTDFTYREGPAIRFVCELTPSGPIGRNVLPGGETFDPSSPHYRDQMELWRRNKMFDLAFHDDAVLKSAMKEYSVNMIGRVRFAPTGGM